MATPQSNSGDNTPVATPIPTQLKVVFIAFTATATPMPTLPPTFTARPTPVARLTPLPYPLMDNPTWSYYPAGQNQMQYPTGYLQPCSGFDMPACGQASWMPKQAIIVTCQNCGYNLASQTSGRTEMEIQGVNLDTLETLYRLFRKHFWQ